MMMSRLIGRIMAAAMVSGLLACPSHSGAEVYELRTYTTNEGKLDNLNSRFRDHTVRLFKKHGIESMGYWVPTEEPQSTYMKATDYSAMR